MTLHKMGIDRVRPLRGGFDEWKRLGFPLEPVRVPNLSHGSSQTA
jgi:3-mercaptopyruvate sulfurtransferase SseA